MYATGKTNLTRANLVVYADARRHARGGADGAPGVDNMTAALLSRLHTRLLGDGGGPPPLCKAAVPL